MGSISSLIYFNEAFRIFYSKNPRYINYGNPTIPWRVSAYEGRTKYTIRIKDGASSVNEYHMYWECHMSCSLHIKPSLQQFTDDNDRHQVMVIPHICELKIYYYVMKRKCKHAVMVIKSTNINKTMTSHLILNWTLTDHDTCSWKSMEQAHKYGAVKLVN